MPQRPDLVASAIVPDYAELSCRTIGIGDVHGQRLPANYRGGASLANTDAGIERRSTATRWCSCRSAAESPAVPHRTSSPVYSMRTITRGDGRLAWQSIGAAVLVIADDVGKPVWRVVRFCAEACQLGNAPPGQSIEVTARQHRIHTDMKPLWFQSGYGDQSRTARQTGPDRRGVMLSVTGAFAYTGGWLSPRRLTQDRMMAAFRVANGAHLGFRRNTPREFASPAGSKAMGGQQQCRKPLSQARPRPGGWPLRARRRHAISAGCGQQPCAAWRYASCRPAARNGAPA